MSIVNSYNLKKILLGLFLFFDSIQNSFAQMMEKGKSKFKVLFNIYHQNSTDGKQVFDNSGREEANVLEPMLFIEHQVDEHTAVNARFIFDFWTAASDTKLDGRTGESRQSPIQGQSRLSARLGARKEKGNWAVGGGMGFSSEYDYRSLNADLALRRSFAEDNFTLGLNLRYYRDGVQLFPDLTPPENAELSEFLPRKIFAVSLTGSQILTRRDIVQTGVDFVNTKGHLESTASSVLINGRREVERLPSQRNRYAFTSKWVHGFNEHTALNLSYRYYLDQWDLDAHTLKVAVLREIHDDGDFVEIWTRLHGQNKVKYYKDAFDTEETFMTSDSDLNEFISYELGLLHSINLENKNFFDLLTLEDPTWTNGVVAYKRSNGLYYFYLQCSLGATF